MNIYDGIRYLVLFSYLYEVCNRTRYVINEKSGITDSIN